MFHNGIVHSGNLQFMLYYRGRGAQVFLPVRQEPELGRRLHANVRRFLIPAPAVSNVLQELRLDWRSQR